MIEVINLVKEFRKPIREEGVLGMLKTLFSRKYESIMAVNDISFKINDGEIVGYIGSNGAGKSTSIKIACGILTPSSGKVLIDGVEPYKKRKVIAQNIGVVFGQKTQLWWDIPLIESFKVFKEIYQISDEDYNERFEFLCETLGIKEFLSQPVRTLSLGQRMRADLAAAWLHNPKVLFLDEPTIGLDVLVKERIRNAIKIMNAKYNTTVILTTHDMKDVEDLCSRIILIETGKIIYDGPLEDIRNKFGDLRSIEVVAKEEIDIDKLDNFDGKLEFSKDESKVIINFDADKISLEDVINYAFKELHAIDMKLYQIGIEEVVKKIYLEEENRGKENV